MTGRDNFDQFIRRHPHPHAYPVARPHATRRDFFRVLGAGLTGSFLARRVRASEAIWQGDVVTRNTARNVIFISLAGAPSHVDTFDLKVTPNVTPSSFAPETIGEILWPAGLMPKLGQRLGDIAIVRSVRSWALQHELGQTWTQIGRSPASALGDYSPNIGSVVALEKEGERRTGQVFPTFLALNAAGAAGSGYLSSLFAPMKLDVADSGIPDTTNPDGVARLDSRLELLAALDGGNRTNSPYGKAMEDYDGFYKAARGLCYNPAVDQAFRFTAAESAAYGSSGFGNACLVARQVLAANQGTRYIQITLGGWDMHQDIYDPTQGIYPLA
ncbi:MAG: DUF1501 domain-containing protein, partial [Bryobacteraceae bacterium]